MKKKHRCSGNLVMITIVVCVNNRCMKQKSFFTKHDIIAAQQHCVLDSGSKHSLYKVIIHHDCIMSQLFICGLRRQWTGKLVIACEQLNFQGKLPSGFISSIRWSITLLILKRTSRMFVRSAFFFWHPRERWDNFLFWIWNVLLTFKMNTKAWVYFLLRA